MTAQELTRLNVITPDAQVAIHNLFTYHPWEEEQKLAGERVRNSLAAAYTTLLAEVPASPSRTRALNMLLDCRMLANQAITFRGEV